MARANLLAESLSVGRAVTVEASADVELEIWRKFLFFAPMSGVGAVTRSPLGTIRSVVETRRLFHSAVAEVFRVGLMVPTTHLRSAFNKYRLTSDVRLG